MAIKYKLTKRQAQILSLYRYYPSQKFVAKKLGCSPENISQILTAIHRKYPDIKWLLPKQKGCQEYSWEDLELPKEEQPIEPVEEPKKEVKITSNNPFLRRRFG